MSFCFLANSLLSIIVAQPVFCRIEHPAAPWPMPFRVIGDRPPNSPYGQWVIVNAAAAEWYPSKAVRRTSSDKR
jgi:hypothetical protein